MNVPRKVSGHFRSLWQQQGPTLIPTTVTNQYKSRRRQIESMKRDMICAELEQLTGKPVARVARSIDGVSRRWTGVKGCAAD
jgi:hypothetical protein